MESHWFLEPNLPYYNVSANPKQLCSKSNSLTWFTYCIECSCKNLYIGQTGREIHSRVKEHFEQWKRKQGAFKDHCTPDHNPQFEEVSIIASDASLEIRECKEAMLIAKAGQTAITNENIGARSAVNRSRGKIFENQWLSVLKRLPPIMKK